MADQGQYKCHFKAESGEDSTTGKVTVKPVSVKNIGHELTESNQILFYLGTKG